MTSHRRFSAAMESRAVNGLALIVTFAIVLALAVVTCSPTPYKLPTCGEGSTITPDGHVHCIQAIFPQAS